jgi:hypothetical protein
MNFEYGFCNGNALAETREYQHRYPDWRQPYQCVFETVHHNLRETGTLMLHEHDGHGRCNVQDEDENMFDIVHNNSSTSTCHTSSVTG